MRSQLSSHQRRDGQGLSGSGRHIQHPEGTASFPRGPVFQGTPHSSPLLGNEAAGGQGRGVGSRERSGRPGTAPPFLGCTCLLAAHPPQGCGPRGPGSLAEGRPASSTSRPLFCDVCFCVQVRLSPETRKLRWQAEEVAPRDPGPWSRGTPQTARYLRSTPSSAARLTECAVAGRSRAPEHTPRGGGAWTATGLSPTCPPHTGDTMSPAPKFLC